MGSERRTQGSLIGADLGDYHVEALIGRGAMGSVYLARDKKLNRHVALKVLLGSLARTPSMVKQFHQEAQAAAPLHHEGIVRMYTAGIEAGTPYIAMEFVDGEPLDRFIVRRGKVSWDVALHIAGQVANALDCAHRHGVVHRDIKPANVILDRKGRVRLTDFGIARVQSRQDASDSTVIGTPQYMSPEQVTGGDVGPASDLFSLGVMVYQMISGELPFRGESSMALINAICEDNPPRVNRLIPSVPDDVARLVAYLMEKDPDRRPASAKVAYGLIHRLQKQRGGQSVVGEALTHFLQEQMEPRPFSTLAEKAATERKRDSKIRKKASSRKHRRRRRYLLHGAAFAALWMLALAAAPIAAGWSRDRATGVAARLDLVTVQESAPGVTRVLFFTDGFRFDDLAWSSDGTRVLLRARGERGALTDGASGALVYSTDTEQVSTLVSPGLALDPEGSMALRFSVDAPDRDARPNVGDSIYLLATRREGGPATLLRQGWDAATPRPEILFEAGIEEARLGGVSSGADRRSGIAIHPSGDRACIALSDSLGGYTYLVERTFDDKPLAAHGSPRTSPGVNIVADSVRYTRDGGRIAYLQRTSDGIQELWMLNAGGSEINGRRILTGVRGIDVAIDPRAERIVYAGGGAGRESEVILADLHTGEEIVRFGAGSVARDAWLEDGSGFFFVANEVEDEAGPQVVFVSAENPRDIRRVTHLREGVEEVYSVSPTGDRIAVLARGTRMPTLYLTEWNGT